MTVSEQFRESWLTAIIGLIMFATGMCLLFWNEVCKYFIIKERKFYLRKKIFD